MECRECGKKFKTIFECNVHRKLHTYYCKLCSKGFYSEKTLIQHETKHNVENEKTCKLCNVIVSAKEYDNHWQKHSIHGNDKYKCLTCHRSFEYLKSFQKHCVKCEDKTCELKCDLCTAKPLGSKFCLQEHVRKHTSEYRYTCDVCYKGFFRKINMLVHMECHGLVIKNHPFQCNECGKKFSKQYNLERHGLRFHYKRKTSDEKYSNSLLIVVRPFVRPLSNRLACR